MSARPQFTLLPGWSMHSEGWGVFAEGLSRWGTVQAIDLPGHGQHAEPLPAATLSAWAVALAGKLQGETWVGWSLGGMLALRAALDHPGRARRLVLLATGASFARRAGWPCGSDAQELEAFAATVKGDPDAALRQFDGWQVAGAERARKTRDWLARQRLGGGVTREGLVAGLEILRHADLRHELTQLELPVLVLAGAADRVLPPESAQRTAALIPGAVYRELPGAGHACFVSHPAEVLAAIGRFVGAEQTA
jgi:pimeloyl-[acyl-carrier protein] methyl ester esterase